MVKMKETKMKNNKVIGTFLKIVRIDSPTGYEQNVSLYITDFLNKIGLKSETDKNGNVITFLNGKKDLQPYLLNAHLDTVEPGRGITPQIKNGWIQSLGDTILGADNKTAVAAILEVLRKLISSPPEKRHPLEIIFTTSEESGNIGASNLDYSRLKSRLGYSFDMSSVNFGDIMLSSPFYNRLDIEIIGKTGHAKAPEKSINVLPVLGRALNKLKVGRISKNTIANIGIVRIGEAVNSIPGNAILNGEVRSTVEKELETTTAQIMKIFNDAIEGSGCKLKTKITRENGGYKYDKNDEFVIKSIKTIKSLGIKPTLIDSFGCADANIFAEHNIKILCIADGSINSHTVNEKIRVSDLERLVDLILKLISIK